jgi:hypothetical protein
MNAERRKQIVEFLFMHPSSGDRIRFAIDMRRELLAEIDRLESELASERGKPRYESLPGEPKIVGDFHMESSEF